MAAESPSAAASVEVSVATDPTLGEILVGVGGKTLYIFTKDSGGKFVRTQSRWRDWITRDGTPAEGRSRAPP